MRQPDVELQIEELVLHGFAATDRHRIAGAVQQEMTRLVAAHGVPASWTTGGGPPVLDGGQFAAAPGTTPRAVGVAIARSVYGGMPR